MKAYISPVVVSRDLVSTTLGTKTLSTVENIAFRKTMGSSLSFGL